MWKRILHLIAADSRTLTLTTREEMHAEKCIILFKQPCCREKHNIIYDLLIFSLCRPNNLHSELSRFSFSCYLPALSARAEVKLRMSRSFLSSKSHQRGTNTILQTSPWKREGETYRNKHELISRKTYKVIFS